MNNQEENNCLLSDVLERNHYRYMRKNNKHRFVVLATQKYDAIYSSFCRASVDFKEKYSVREKPILDEETIIRNVNELMAFYCKQNFVSDIEIVVDEIESTICDEIIHSILKAGISCRNIYLSGHICNGENIEALVEELKTKSDNQLFVDATIEIGEDREQNLCALHRAVKFIESGIIRKINFWVTPNNIKYLTSLYSDILLDDELCQYFAMLSLKLSTTNKWNEEHIEMLTDFYDLYIPIVAEILGSTDKFFDYILNENSIISISDNRMFDCEDRLSCGMQNHFFINAVSMKLVMCPGIQHPRFDIGVYENGEITEENVELEITKDHLKMSTLPHCEKCMYVPFCKGFCLASSFNEHGNLLIPGYEQCIFTRRRYNYLLSKYKDMGLIEYLKSNADSPFKIYMLRALENISRMEVSND